jgi:hypothetical protein
MIKSLHAENFRCFKGLDLSDLKRVNVVVGVNATGKTALLEAIRLALAGTPNALWGMNQARGVFPGGPQPITREWFESLWSAYFFNFDASKAIFMDFGDSENHHATTRIYYDVQRSVTAVPQQLPQQQPQQPPQVSPSSFIPPLAFERTSFSGKSSTLYASAQMQGGLNFDSGPELGPVTESFPSSWNFNPLLPAQMFSQLSLQQREMAIVDAVRDEFEPSLESLVVLSPSGSPGLYAGLRYLKEKLPIGYLSAGISRFIAMLSAVLIRGEGVVLIDEIENGISYKIFQPLWKYLLRFAIDNNTQIFASTHSLECVRALLPAMQGHEDDFTLLRAERTNGSSSITLVPGRFLESAIDQGVEVR